MTGVRVRYPFEVSYIKLLTLVDVFTSLLLGNCGSSIKLQSWKVRFPYFQGRNKHQIGQREFTMALSCFNHPTLADGQHQSYMEYAIDQACLSPPTPTEFCVGAVLVDADKNEILSTGYSMELPGDRPGDPGNTHAEQCCFIKVAEKHNVSEKQLAEVLPRNTVLYSSMEPCNERLSGNRTCVDRILGLNGAIKVVYVGVKEPEVFIGHNGGRTRLEEAGIPVVIVEGMQDRILKISNVGHER